MNDVMYIIDCTFKCVTAVIVNSIISPVFILVLLPVAACFFVLKRFYITSSR